MHLLDVRLSVPAWATANHAAVERSRAFQFGQKGFDSILATESIFFDSIRQFDKFAASTLIFK